MAKKCFKERIEPYKEEDEVPEELMKVFENSNDYCKLMDISITLIGQALMCLTTDVGMLVIRGR